MPNIKTTGIYPNDSISVRAIMLWPGEAERRRQYYAADYANGFVYEHEPSSIYPWNASLIQALLEAPSWSQLKYEAEQRTKHAIVAGYVLAFMFLMDRLRDRLPPRGIKGASLSKARFLVEEWARRGATYGDGTKMLVSEKSIKDSWRKYRGVAHLWAAIEMNRIFEFAPPGKLMYAEHFHTFMRAAAYMQMFGTTWPLDNRSGRPSEFLLPPEATWLIDTNDYRPTIMLPDNWTRFENAPFMVMLRDYAA